MLCRGVLVVVVAVVGCGDNQSSTDDAAPRVYCRTIGARVIFLAFPNKLYVADGNRVTLIGDTSGFDDEHIQWSSDGTRIYYQGPTDSVEEAILQVTDTGSDPVVVTTQQVGRYFDVSPDGTRIAYPVADGFVVQQIGSPTPLVTIPGSNPTWSPDSSKIAYVGGSGVTIANADGTDPVSTELRAFSEFRKIQFSPDGTKLAAIKDLFSEASSSGAFIIEIADSSGALLAKTSLGGTFDLAWSPDSTHIAFSRVVGSNDLEVFAIAADGTGEQNLTNAPGHDTHPRWSPDGRYIFFNSGRNGERESLRMNADGTDPQQVITNLGPYSDNHDSEVTRCL